MYVMLVMQISTLGHLTAPPPILADGRWQPTNPINSFHVNIGSFVIWGGGGVGTRRKRILGLCAEHVDYWFWFIAENRLQNK